MGNTEREDRAMNSSSNGYNFRAALSAVLAAAIVGTSGLALDKDRKSVV